MLFARAWSRGVPDSARHEALQLLQPVEHDRDSAEAGSSSEIKYLRVPWFVAMTLHL